jgi:HD-like signal output (HDOD) protein
MKRILFVDDEPNVLEGLERMLFPMRKEWSMHFAKGGAEALECMKQAPYDVVVSDMRMPDIDGVRLLSEVMKLYPQTVRFILSGQCDRDSVLRSVGPTHQFLAKPCSAATLKTSVERALALRDLLRNESIKRVASQTDALPAMPDVYAKLMMEIRSPDPSMSAVGKIIQSDVAMAAKILQLVNSAFFGLRQHVMSAAQAVTLLGLDTVRALVLMVGVFAQADKKRLPRGFSLESLALHSTAVGSYGQAICQTENAAKDLAADAFMAGLLHDVGMLVLANACADAYGEVIEAAISSRLRICEVEQAAFQCTHAEVGAYLLGIWGIPNPIVEAVAYHHCPGRCLSQGFSPLLSFQFAVKVS